MLKIAIFIILRHNCLNSFCLTRSFASSKTSIICWKGFRVTKEKNKKTKTYKLYTVTNRSLGIIFKERKYFHIFNIFLVIIIVDFQKTQSYLGSSSQVIITFYNWLTNGMITIKKKNSLSQRCVTQRICLRTNNLFSILQRDWDYRSTADSSEYFNRV